MPKLFKMLISAAVAVLGAPSLAGVWTSGGSELIKDSANPWYIQNTAIVKTCLVVDPAIFHTKRSLPESLRDGIAAAVEYWRKEFAKSWSVAEIIKVGTQSFKEGDFIQAKPDHSLPRKCPTDTDLTIQFGWLSQEQQEYLKSHSHKPGDLVAITVRTDYDRQQLAAKGFIFISGDTGPWGIKDKSIVANPWALGAGHLLTEVLKHEFGHVFGLPHMGIEGPMAVDYAERSLQRGTAEDLAVKGSDAPFFKIEGPFTIRHLCYPAKTGMRAGWRKFLGASAADICVHITLDSDQIKFSTGPDFDHLQERGSLKLEGQERFMWQDAVRVYAPPEQKAFTCPDPTIGAGGCPWIVGPMIKLTDRAGTYLSNEGLRRQVAVTFSPLGLGFAQSKFSAEIDGEWHWNLDWEY